MCVCAEQTAVDLLVVLVVINLRQPSAISHCAKYNIVSLTSLIPFGSQQTAGPTCLPNLYAGHALHQSAVQIHFDMPPNASMDIIKRRHLLGKALGKYTCALILSQACTIGHIPPAAACWLVC